MTTNVTLTINGHPVAYFSTAGAPVPSSEVNAHTSAIQTIRQDAVANPPHSAPPSSTGRGQHVNVTA